MNSELLDPRTARDEGERIAEQMGFTDPDQIDAFRHAVWQAALTQAFGEAVAHDGGNLIETLRTLRGDNKATDRNMDLWNNREGRNIGKEAQAQGFTDAQLYDKIAEAVRNGRLVTKHDLDQRVDPRHFDLRLIPKAILDIEKIRSIGDTISDFFDQARRWRPLGRDPLVLDLDGDGIETVAANGTVLFDHDGDGVQHGTGWVRGDDGFLVLDKNGNGRIDNGTELFGVMNWVSAPGLVGTTRS